MQPQDQHRLAALHLAARQVWGDRFLARAAERTTAGGTEATGYRDYTTGDDFRHVDWNLCARHDELRTREYHGAADASSYILLDSSASMGLGSPSKFEYGRGMAASLVYLAIAQLDRVSLLTVADGIVAGTAPLRGRAALPALNSFLHEAQPTGGATDLRAVADQFVCQSPRPGIVVLVSDLLDPAGFEPALDLLRRHRHEPYVLQLFTPEEAAPQVLGKVELYDVETQQTRRFTLNEQDLANYQVVFDEFLTRVASYCGRVGLNFCQTSTAASAESVLRRIIHTSAAARRRAAG